MEKTAKNKPPELGITVSARLFPTEHEHFKTIAKIVKKKPGALLRQVVQAYIAQAGFQRAQELETAKIEPAAQAELERFELRLPAFLKGEIKRRAMMENMSSSEWVAAFLQSQLMNIPVFTEPEIEAVSFANRQLAALGRNLNQIARSMNRAELIGVGFNKEEILTLEGIQLLKSQITRLRTMILSLIVARNRAWGVENDTSD